MRDLSGFQFSLSNQFFAPLILNNEQQSKRKITRGRVGGAGKTNNASNLAVQTPTLVSVPWNRKRNVVCSNRNILYKMLQWKEKKEKTDKGEKGGGKRMDRSSVVLQRALSSPPISSIVRGTNEAMVTIFYFYDFAFQFSLFFFFSFLFTIAKIATSETILCTVFQR